MAGLGTGIARSRKNALIQTLREENEKQQERISRLLLELEGERDAKKQWQGRFLELSKEAEIEKAGHNPYVVLLIDGDGMIFTENYLVHPQAGHTAAADLVHHTRELISNSGICTPIDAFEIVIRVFGNPGQGQSRSKGQEEIRGMSTQPPPPYQAAFRHQRPLSQIPPARPTTYPAPSSKSAAARSPPPAMATATPVPPVATVPRPENGLAASKWAPAAESTALATSMSPPKATCPLPSSKSQEDITSSFARLSVNAAASSPTTRRTTATPFLPYGGIGASKWAH